MSRRFCISCGVKLTRKNRYKRCAGSRKYSNICKECRKKQVSKRYRVGKKKFCIIRGERYTLIFRSQADRRAFVSQRRMQRKFGKTKVSPSSNVGRSVWLQAIKKTDQGERYATWEPARCEECGGTVRYDKLGYEVCDDCGLVRNDLSLEQYYALSIADLAANYGRNERPIVDYYHAEAYRRHIRAVRLRIR